MPWLDLVRDPAQRDKLRALDQGIRPDAATGRRRSKAWSAPEAAKARWQALDAFAEANGHLLVTNGPYKLKSFTPEVTTLDVIREFTYPIGTRHVRFPRLSGQGADHAGSSTSATASC